MRRNSGSDMSTPSPAQRLPVNHRRHRVAPEHRKRVATACNNCNVRRIKCSGERPCSQCRNTARDCHYPVVLEKVTVPRVELDELRDRCARLEQCLEQAVPDPMQRHGLYATNSVPNSTNDNTPASPDRAIPTASMGTPASTLTSVSASVSGSVPGVPAIDSGYMDSEGDGNNSGTNDRDEDPSSHEGRWLSDPDGTTRYLGSTSGATFLDLLKEFMSTSIPLAWPGSAHPETTFLGSLGRYQTFDSRPLVIRNNVHPNIIPSKAEIIIMSNRLRYFLQDGSGEFVSGGIYYWPDLNPSFLDSRPPSMPADSRVALVHAAFAVACLLDTEGDMATRNKGDISFAKARVIMGNPLDTAANTLCHLAVLAMLSVYLMEMNRRDAAYMHLSLAMHIAVMHGLHRGFVTDEVVKRIFWTLYILDRWLGMLMGRPPVVPEEAIRIPLPEDTEDLPPAAGLRAHVELMKISTYIALNVYRIASTESYLTSTSNRIDRALNWLLAWKAKLPPALQISEQQFTSDRACCELHMSYNQLIILTVRPMYFIAVKKAVAERFLNKAMSPSNHAKNTVYQLQECTEAARTNVRLGQWIRSMTPGHKLVMSCLHYIFNAAIILLLQQLLFEDNTDNAETDTVNIMFVIDVFANESVDNFYATDCARVLRDLSALVHRLRERSVDDINLAAAQAAQAQAANSQGLSNSMAPQPATTTAYDVDFILNPEIPPGALPTGTYDALELWMNQNNLHLYNNNNANCLM